MADEYIRAAPDSQLSSSQSHLLATLLAEEDQHDYNQLLKITLPQDILHILHQFSSALLLSSSTIWTTVVLLKKLIIQQYSIDLFTLIACITLSFKYQESSTDHIDYHFIAQSCQIDNIQLIHDAEIELLDVFSSDICTLTPDHFFSYLSNLTTDDHKMKQIIDQSRSSLSHQTLDVLFNYPSSVITLSLLLLHHQHQSDISSNNFISEQMKSFLLHKKDPSSYISQLVDCTSQLQSVTSSS